MNTAASTRPRRRKLTTIEWLVMASFVALAMLFLWGRLGEWQARIEFRRAVGHAAQACIDGVRVEDASVLLAVLGQVDHVEPHHSHATIPVRIDLDCNSATYVVVARDSRNSTEFWAFWPATPGHAGEPGREAGRIVSGDLDVLMKRRGL